jgi:hypothetical protein
MKNGTSSRPRWRTLYSTAPAAVGQGAGLKPWISLSGYPLRRAAIRYLKFGTKGAARGFLSVNVGIQATSYEQDRTRFALGADFGRLFYPATDRGNDGRRGRRRPGGGPGRRCRRRRGGRGRRGAGWSNRRPISSSLPLSRPVRQYSLWPVPRLNFVAGGTLKLSNVDSGEALSRRERPGGQTEAKAMKGVSQPMQQRAVVVALVGIIFGTISQASLVDASRLKATVSAPSRESCQPRPFLAGALHRDRPLRERERTELTFG